MENVTVFIADLFGKEEQQKMFESLFCCKGIVQSKSKRESNVFKTNPKLVLWNRINYIFMWVVRSGPLLLWPSKICISILPNLLIYDNIAWWRHKNVINASKSFLFTFPLSFFLTLFPLDVSLYLFTLKKIAGNRRQQDLNAQPPGLLHGESDHRTTMSCQINYFDITCLATKFIKKLFLLVLIFEVCPRKISTNVFLQTCLCFLSITYFYIFT